ncbi:MAG: ATP-binding cassette domain-containing protein [Oscillospiraceae bacterium]|nr:ATP-binding cassette domain-containing protein [Oscillospiraceae bacterium]
MKKTSLNCRDSSGSVISLKGLNKEFKTLNRREGIRGGLLDLFSRNYKVIKAVSDVSLEIMPGERVGLLGPNGAGKSTTIKMMSGVLKPSGGEILVNGFVPYTNRVKNAQNIGVVFGQRSQLWWALPLIESFKILKDIYLIEDKAYNEMMELYHSILGADSGDGEENSKLEVLLKKPVRQMSLGQRTLSDILASFLHNPKVVFLDEPTIGLDVTMKAKIRELVLELNRIRGTTVILTTHDIGDVDALCERVIIIDKGGILYDDTIEKLKGYFGAYRTLKVKFGKHDDWHEYLIDEDKSSVMDKLAEIGKEKKIADIKIEEIATEDVIKKIYSGDEQLTVNEGGGEHETP